VVAAFFSTTAGASLGVTSAAPGSNEATLSKVAKRGLDSRAGPTLAMPSLTCLAPGKSEATSNFIRTKTNIGSNIQVFRIFYKPMFASCSMSLVTPAEFFLIEDTFFSLIRTYKTYAKIMLFFISFKTRR
jgi:hypothetical protein